MYCGHLLSLAVVTPGKRPVPNDMIKGSLYFLALLDPPFRTLSITAWYCVCVFFASSKHILEFRVIYHRIGPKEDNEPGNRLRRLGIQQTSVNCSLA